MSRSERIAAYAALAAASLLVSLPWLLPLDEWAYLIVQRVRSCEVDVGVRWVDLVVRGILAALILATVLPAPRSRSRRLLTLAVLAVAGGLAGELLKTVFERARPNAGPGIDGGNSFPSGHVMNTTMAALAAGMLMVDAGWPRWVRALGLTLAAGCVIAQAAFRVLAGAHWLSDVPLSVLLAVAWMYGEPALARLPRRRLVATALIAVAAFTVFLRMPSLRIHLPKAFDASAPPVASLELGRESSRLRGAWSHGWREPVGGVSWAVEPEAAVELDGAAAVVEMVLRPPRGVENRRACCRIEILVNGWKAPPIALTRGWRTYYLRPPDGTLRDGPNVVTFRILDDARYETGSSDPGLVAFHGIRLLRD